QQQQQQQRKNSLATLMRNSVGSTRESLRVAEMAGPAVGDPASLWKGSSVEMSGGGGRASAGDVKVEVVRASAEDMAILQALEARQRDEAGKRESTETLTRRLREQMKERRSKVKKEGKYASGVEISQVETGSLGETKCRSKSFDDITREGDSDLLPSSNPLGSSSMLGANPTDSEIHMTLSATSLSTLNQPKSPSSYNDPGATPLASPGSRAFASTPQGLDNPSSFESVDDIRREILR
ncbi:hypothetical protein HK104_007944, partial [Borealophlyctis nickersoniae]